MKYTLTFEMSRANKDELFVHGSPEGLTFFANSLLKLVEDTKDGSFNDSHFFSNNWGGSELTSELQDIDAILINHVKVFCWNHPE